MFVDASLYLDETFDSGIPNCPGTRFTLQLNQPPMGMENVNGSTQFFVGHNGNLHEQTNSADSASRDSFIYPVRENSQNELPADMNVL